MAIMYPNNLEGYNYTQSEKYFYEVLRDNLSNDFYVFYSLRWFDIVNGLRVDSECDFLIFNPKYGYLTIELKGGVDIIITNGEWAIKDFSKDEGYRTLRRSPFKQAEENMYYFKRYYENNYAAFYRGIYGFAVAFPFYNVDDELGCEYPQLLIIDKSDLDDIESRIIGIFNYWRGGNETISFIPNNQSKFLSLINKRVALSVAAGALIEVKEKQLDIINRIQDNYLDFVSMYNRLYIKGGAGTGKTWIGIKKAIRESEVGRSVIFITPTENLSEYVSRSLDGYKVKVVSVNSIEYEQKYDVVIVDEAQDISKQDSLKIETLVKQYQKSSLLVLYDDNQEVIKRKYEKYFDIKTPEFKLVENIRNTSSIYRWAVDKTGIGKSIRLNLLQGMIPEFIQFKERYPAINKLEEILINLISKELVNNKKIIVLSDVDYNSSILSSVKQLGKFKIVFNNILGENEILFKEVKEFKGLESDVVIYIRNKSEANDVINYIAYTRARFYLYVIECF